MQIVRFAKKMLLFLPFIFIIVGFNYCVDPANMFKRDTYYKEIVNILLKGINVANLTNYDERLLQKEYISNLTGRKDIILLGSSRVMQFSSHLFNGYSFLNNGVSGAVIEDDMAIYWMYRKRGIIPSVVIIGLDPWLLNKSNGQTRYKSIIRDYQEITNDIMGKNDSQQILQILPPKYFELFSPSYFQSSFWYWLNGLREGKKKRDRFFPTTKNEANEAIKHADGSISYDLKSRSVTPSEAHLSAIEYANENPVYSLNNFNRLDPHLIDMFEKFIDFLHKDKVEIIFFLPPYHPAAYNILGKSDKYKIIVDAQRYFEKYAKIRRIKLIGSFNPDDLSLGESDFLDGMHVKTESVSRIFKLNCF